VILRLFPIQQINVRRGPWIISLHGDNIICMRDVVGETEGWVHARRAISIPHHIRHTAKVHLHYLYLRISKVGGSHWSSRDLLIYPHSILFSSSIPPHSTLNEEATCRKK
jgi:hypothetical protein